MKGFYDQHVTALNGILDKLPEAMRPELAKLRDGLTDQLNKLPALEDKDNHGVLAFLADAMARMQEYATALMGQITAMKSELGTTVTALNGLKDQVAKGELLSKDKAAEACALARTEGANSLKPELRATRKGALELAGLPVPSDDILDLPSKDFDARVAAAKDQVGKLGAKGLKLGGKGATWVKQLAWLGATEFAGQLTALEEVLGSGPAKPAADPLLGTKPESRDDKAQGPQITLV